MKKRVLLLGLVVLMVLTGCGTTEKETKTKEKDPDKLVLNIEDKKEDGEITDVMEFVQYGLYLALFQDNIVKAKSDFADFRSSFEFDTDGKGLKELVELWQKEI